MAWQTRPVVKAAARVFHGTARELSLSGPPTIAAMQFGKTTSSQFMAVLQAPFKLGSAAGTRILMSGTAVVLEHALNDIEALFGGAASLLSS